MSRRPNHTYQIPCMRCDYQTDCDKYVKIDNRMVAQREKMWNNTDLSCMDCILRTVLKMKKEDKARVG
mgnify:CR=1 FL=1